MDLTLVNTNGYIAPQDSDKKPHWKKNDTTILING